MPEYIVRFDGGYRFLSNFWKCDIEFEGKTYPTTEAAFQAAKTFNDTEKDLVRLTATPGAAKRAGRRVTLRPDWEEVKDSIMLEVVRIKFKTHSELAVKLLATGDAILVEGNTWHDCFFGVCVCEKCNGKGKNVLGEVLMMVRKELKATQSYPKYPADPNSTVHVIQGKSDHNDIELEQI